MWIDLADFLREKRDSVIAEWEQAVRALPRTADLSRPELIDFIPPLFDQLIEIIVELKAGKTPDLPYATAEKHAVDRLEEGFDLEEVVIELGLLRDCILRLWKDSSGTASDEMWPELRLLNQAIDQAIVACVTRYNKARDRILRVLDRVSSTALAAKDLDHLLEGLISAFTDEVPSVDSAAILLASGDRLTLGAASGLDEDVSNRFELRIGEGFAGKVAAERRAIQLKSAATDPLVRKEGIHGKDVRALYGVPLIDGGQVLGVAFIGSLTAKQFSTQDRILFGSMASRATAAIHQHALRDQAERAVALRDQILGIVSHDLRNPVGTISLAKEALERNPAVLSDPAAYKHVEVIGRATARASRLIADLLDVSSLQAGKLTLEQTSCDLLSLLCESVEAHDSLAREQGIELQVEEPGDNAEICCDRGRIQQVLGNLIGNALKFCDRGDRVVVRAQVRDGQAMVTVADTGPGIAAEHLDHIFDLYWKGRGEKLGTGLGLTICKGIVESHGGRIWVESQQGAGSSFHFNVPVTG